MITLIEEQEPWSFNGKVVVVDTSVVVDFALRTSLKHKDAISLFSILVEKGIRIRAPYHSAFEFLSAVRRNVLFEKAQQSSHANLDSKDIVVSIYAVPINEAFVHHYKTDTLPQLKAGDLIYLALAHGDMVPLITEDQELYDKARKVGVDSYKIGEFLAKILNAG